MPKLCVVWSSSSLGIDRVGLILSLYETHPKRSRVELTCDGQTSKPRVQYLRTPLIPERRAAKAISYTGLPFEDCIYRYGYDAAVGLGEKAPD